MNATDRHAMKVGDVARALGVSTSTVKLYEREGLVPSVPRTVTGQRKYAPQDVARLRAAILERQREKMQRP